jgi:hypothetical protein
VGAQQVKGTSLNLTLDLVREREGDDAILMLVLGLPERVRKELPEDLVILPNEMVSFEAWAEVLVTAEALFGRERSIARESARRGYRQLFKTTYKRWVREGDPCEAIRRLPSLWEQVTKGIGTYEVEDLGPDEQVVHIVLAIEQRYHGVTIERAAGTLEAMIEACAARGTVETKRVVAGADLRVRIDRRRRTTMPPPA